MFIRSLTLVALAVTALSANASISLTSGSASYAQNFDSLSNNCPRGCAFTNDSTVAGWSLYRSDLSAGAGYLADDGSGTLGGSGAFHSLGNAGSSERSLGVLPTANANFGTPSPAVGTPAGWIALSATNNSGASLGAFTLSYAGEQWYPGSSPSGLTVQYGFGSSFAGVTNWTAAGAGFDFSAPVQGSSGPVDGNGAGHVGGLGGTVGGLNWNDGDTLWVRWEATASGTSASMGIDDVNLSVSAVPEPGSWILMIGGLGLVGAAMRRRAQR